MINDDLNIMELQDYLGKIAQNDLVVYIKGGDLNSLGKYKKDIWKVLKIRYTDEGKMAEIENISKANTSFSTSTKYLLDIDILRDSLSSEEFNKIFSTRSLDIWRNTLNSKLYNHKFKTDDYIILYDEVDNEFSTKVKGEFLDAKTGEVTMMNRLVNDNMNAAKTGAVLSAGTTLNRVVKDAVRNQVPRKYRKLLDTPFADIVVANVANVAVQNFAKTNRKAQVATNAMMEAAMVEFMNSFNLDKIISDTLQNVNLDDLIDNND